MKFTLKLEKQGGWAVNFTSYKKIYGLELLRLARKVSGIKLKHELIRETAPLMHIFISMLKSKQTWKLVSALPLFLF